MADSASGAAEMEITEELFKIAFVDLDGTLLNSKLALSEFAAISLSLVRQSGAKVVLASGRPLSSIKRLAAGLDDPDIYAVASNGGCVVSLRSGEVLQRNCMDQAIVQSLIRVSAEAGIAVCLYQTHDWYVSVIDPYVELEKARSGSEPAGLIGTADTDLKVVKAMFVGENRRLQELQSQLNAASAPLEMFFTYPEYLEVMPAGISKVTACETLLQGLDLSWSDAVVIGDGLNDLTMMLKARGRVAMENAHPNLKAVSNVIAPSNDDDGAAVALLALCVGDLSARARLQFRSGTSDAK